MYSPFGNLTAERDLVGSGRTLITTQVTTPLLPVLTLAEQRYSVRGDAIGKKLAIEPLTAEGRIRLRLGQLDKETAVVKLHVMLVCEDGTAFTVTCSRNRFRSPMRKPVGSPLYFKSCGASPITQPAKKRFSAPMVVWPVRYT